MKTKVFIWAIFLLSSVGTAWAQKDFSSGDIPISGQSSVPATYTGTGVSTTTLSLMDTTVTLVVGADYTLSVTLLGNTVTEFKDAGVYTVTFTAVSAGYTGIKSTTITIAQADINGAIFSALSSKEFTGSAITLQASDMSATLGSYTLATSDFSVDTHSNNTNAGTATATLNGIGNFTSTKTVDFSIVPIDISNATMTIDVKQHIGSPITLITSEIAGTYGSYTLTAGDFTIDSYNNNTNVGMATVKLIGQGNFDGEDDFVFIITPIPIDISSAVINGIPDTVVYTGSAIEPVPTSVVLDTITLDPTDYAVEYQSNTEAGTASVTIIAYLDGYLTGSSAPQTFVIVKSLAHADIKVTIPKQTHTGLPIVPANIVVLDNKKPLVLGTDYQIKSGSPLNNIEAGVNTASLILESVSGGVYTDETARISFTIEVAPDPDPNPDPSNYQVTIPRVKGLITSPSPGTYNAEEGENFVLIVEIDSIKRGLLKENARKVKVLVNGNEVEATYLGNGAYRVIVEDLQSDISFDIYQEDGDATGVEEVNQTVKVYGRKGMLYIETIEPLRATVYSISGQLRLDKQVYESESFSLSQGIYIAKVGDKTYKVTVK